MTEQNSDRLHHDRMVFSAGMRKSDQLTFTAESSLGAEEISFSVPLDFHAHWDSIAACLSTLCGRQYKSVHFDFPISERCRSALEQRFSNVSSAGSVLQRADGTNVGLGFSGGIDSLAAYLLAPGMTCVSIDFGIPRERIVFETLQPDVICETNLRRNPKRNHHSFMAAPLLLYADYLNLSHIGFGAIFEQTVKNYWYKRTRQIEAFDSAGISEGTITRGLTELGTAQVVLTLSTDRIIQSSLTSVSEPGREKFFRKHLLVDTIRYMQGGPLPNFEAYVYPIETRPFGRVFVEDFLTLYFLAIYGFDIVSRWVGGLRALDRDRIKNLDVGWYRKYNPMFLNEVPAPLRTTMRRRLDEASIRFFEPKDWEGYRAVEEILAAKHKFPPRDGLLREPPTTVGA